jgi:hypothetical protein
MHASMPEEMASVPLFTRKGNTSLYPYNDQIIDHQTALEVYQ